MLSEWSLCVGSRNSLKTILDFTNNAVRYVLSVVLVMVFSWLNSKYLLSTCYRGCCLHKRFVAFPWATIAISYSIPRLMMIRKVMGALALLFFITLLKNLTITIHSTFHFKILAPSFLSKYSQKWILRSAIPHDKVFSDPMILYDAAITFARTMISFINLGLTTV